MTDVGAAVAAIEDARAARARLADMVRCPAYMHALFGAMYGALVAAQAAPAVWVFVVEGAVVLAAAAMYVWTRRRLGMFVNGYRRGATRSVVAALLISFLIAMALAGWCKLELHLIWPALVLGALMFAVGTWASVAWQRTYRRELLTTAAPAA